MVPTANGVARALVAAMLAVVSFAPKPAAQGGLTITFSSFGTSAWPSGPDYATDVLGDPWDLCNPEDLGLDPSETRGWTNFTINNATRPCTAGGTTTTVNGAIDSAMSLLYRGEWDLPNPGKTGIKFPIDTSKYQKLAFRMSDSLGGGDNPQVYWFHYSWLDPAIPGSDLNNNKLLSGTIRGWQTYVVDLSQGPANGIPWTNGKVLGLRIDPNGNHVGQDIFFQWVRLTVNDAAPGAALQTISWNGSAGKIDLYDAAGTTLIMNVATNVASGYKWNYGVVPPGAYTLKVTAGTAVGTKAFTINNPPLIQVTDPDETGGSDDYASTVLGNAWDMNGPEDVQLTGSDNYTPTPAQFSSGLMTATNTNNDPNVTLLGVNNNATPIDTTKYRYLTFRMMVDGPLDIANGSVARVFWSSQTFMSAPTATTTKDIIVWPGWNSYTIDLSTLSPGGSGGLETTGAAELWTSGAKRHFRIDPHEFTSARAFHIDYVKLAAIDQAVNNSFTIKWTGADLDGGTPAVNLYYDTDTNPSNGKTLIASNVAMSAGQYVWATGGVTPGDYWIYAEASDGVQVYGRYSTGQVRIFAPLGPPRPSVSIEAPATGASVVQPFTVSGSAIDLASPTWSGVDVVQVLVTAVGASTPTFVGDAQYYVRRDDLTTILGSRFTNAGFQVSVSGLVPGTYIVSAYARSTVTGRFYPSRSVTITIPASQPKMYLDMPASDTMIAGAFSVAGWALDQGAPSGTGIDFVDVYAWPIHNPDDGWIGPPIFVGRSNYGQSRPDVGGAFGLQFASAGFSLSNVTLNAGRYRVVAYAHSRLAAATNTEAHADITISAGPSAPNR